MENNILKRSLNTISSQSIIKKSKTGETINQNVTLRNERKIPKIFYLLEINF